MSGRVTDDGLSEVIGFILIIAIIVILGSLYMTYVVPSQGRDAEIQHMQTVEKFFTDFKMNIDALWLNDQVGVSFNEIFQLGTGGQTSAGAFSIFPIMQPVSSFGTIRVTPDNPQVTLKINGLWVANESTSAENIAETQVADPDTLLVVNYDTGGVNSTHPVPDTLVVYSTNGDWTATLEMVNETFLLPGDINWNVTPQGYVTNLSFSKDSQNALAVTISKNGYKTLDRMRINSTIGDIKRNYSINLLDEAYGLHNDVIFPFGVNYTYYNNGIAISKGNPFELYGYKKTEREAEIPAGTFSYESSNKYWINQNYLYTLGGVFLDQNGIQTYRTKPWISLEQKPGYEGGPAMIPDVNLNVLSISQIAGNMSGPDNIQISSKLLDIDDAFEDINDNRRGFHLANLRPNAAYAYINITNSNPDSSWGNSWNQTLNSLVRDSGIPFSYYTPFPVKTDASGCTVSILIHGFYNTGSGGALDTTPDLFVNYENIESEISISGPVYV